MSKDESVKCFNLGVEAYKQGDYEKALLLFDKAIKLNPNCIKAYNSKGFTLHALGRNEKILECFDKAIELDPKNIDAYDNKIEILKRLGLYEEALLFYDKMIELDIGFSFPHYYNKGLTLADHFGLYEEALLCYDKVIELDLIKYSNMLHSSTKFPKYVALTFIIYMDRML